MFPIFAWKIKSHSSFRMEDLLKFSTQFICYQHRARLWNWIWRCFFPYSLFLSYLYPIMGLLRFKILNLCFFIYENCYHLRKGFAMWAFWNLNLPWASGMKDLKSMYVLNMLRVLGVNMEFVFVNFMHLLEHASHHIWRWIQSLVGCHPIVFQIFDSE